VVAPAASGLPAQPLSPSRLAWRRFPRHTPALISAVVLAVLAIVVFFPPLLTDKDPLRSTDVTKAVSPSWTHPAGTNGIGVDQLSRILHGGQISLKVGIAVALASALIGVAIGALA